MSEIFTNYIRNQQANQQTDDLQLVEHLGEQIQRQLRAMGQWNQPPSFLGYLGDSWKNPDVFDDLVQDIYYDSILKNKANLAVMVAQNGTCEAAVVQKITWFLQTRHKKGNPASSRIFSNLREATRRLIANGIAFQADDSQVFCSSTIVLRGGHQIPATDRELLGYFQQHVGIQRTAEILSVDNEDGISAWNRIIEESFGNGLPGFQAGELSNLFSSVLRRESNPSADSDEDLMKFFESLSDTRTTGHSASYSQGQVPGSTLSIDDLRMVVSKMSDISEQRRKQLSELVDIVFELINDEDEIPTNRSIAIKLKKGKSTVNDWIKQLKAACIAHLDFPNK